MRPVTPSAAALVAGFEALRLRAYPDPASGDKPWSIGYGSTKGVTQGMVITKAEAIDRLDSDLETAAAQIWAHAGPGPTNAMSENQYDALLSWCFNCGPGEPVGSKKEHTIWKLIRALRFDSVPDQIKLFVYAAGKKNAGLEKRRAKEAALWASSLPAKPTVPVIGLTPVATAVLAPAAIVATHTHSQYLPVILSAALALAVAWVVLLLIKSRRNKPMPSQQFTDALTNLLAAKDAQAQKLVEDAVAPLNARLAELEATPAVTDTGPQVDADDTAAIVAATPAPPTP